MSLIARVVMGGSGEGSGYATQHSLLRLLTTTTIQKAYAAGPISNVSAWRKCEELLALPQVVWMAEPPGFPTIWASLRGPPSSSPKVWMDAYLAAFAIGHNIPLVTADRDLRNFESSGLKLLLLK